MCIRDSLKGTLLHLMRALFGEKREVRFRTHFFPFTEPSIESDVSCHMCDGVGCPVCKQSGWIEMGGSGIVDPNVLEFVGYDPEEVSGFAFGLGLERSPCCATVSPTSVSSGRTTCASRASSE